MRSPKQRSRSKQNRPRTLGNIINRVFDSSGPEGKVRGTPQQIIEKYQVLARDAQLSNDRVAAENFQQHAEHYARMLAQATREMQAEAEARRIAHEEQQQRNRQQQDERAQRFHSGPQQHPRRQDDQPEVTQDAPQPEVIERPTKDSFALIEQDSAEDTALVETPEVPAAPIEAQPAAREPRRPNPRRDAPRRDGQSREGQSREGARRAAPPADAKPEQQPEPAPQVDATAEPSTDAKPRRNQRRPRKPAEETASAAE
ncbi:MAG: DUF4167 domain-containing protein [Roseinatronobacter sp.]